MDEQAERNERGEQVNQMLVLELPLIRYGRVVVLLRRWHGRSKWRCRGQHE